MEQRIEEKGRGESSCNFFFLTSYVIVQNRLPFENSKGRGGIWENTKNNSSTALNLKKKNRAKRQTNSGKKMQRLQPKNKISCGEKNVAFGSERRAKQTARGIGERKGKGEPNEGEPAMVFPLPHFPRSFAALSPTLQEESLFAG